MHIDVFCSILKMAGASETTVAEAKKLESGLADEVYVEWLEKRTANKGAAQTAKPAS